MWDFESLAGGSACGKSLAPDTGAAAVHGSITHLVHVQNISCALCFYSGSCLGTCCALQVLHLSCLFLGNMGSSLLFLPHFPKGLLYFQ